MVKIPSRHSPSFITFEARQELYLKTFYCELRLIRVKYQHFSLSSRYVIDFFFALLASLEG